MSVFLTNSTFMTGPNLHVQWHFLFTVAMFEMSGSQAKVSGDWKGSQAKDSGDWKGRMKFDKGTIDDPCRDMNVQ